MDKSEIASDPEMSLFIMGYGTDHCIRVAFENGFQPGGLVVQFIDMFDIIDIGQVLLMIERDISGSEAISDLSTTTLS